jgi:hypothetical protein
MDKTKYKNITQSTSIFPKGYLSVTRFVKQNIPSHVFADDYSQLYERRRGPSVRWFDSGALQPQTPGGGKKSHLPNPLPTLPWRRARTSTLVWSK